MASILKPKVLRVKCSDHEAIAMRASQVPLPFNNLTTGHKLQGSGVDAQLGLWYSFSSRDQAECVLENDLSEDLMKNIDHPHATTFWRRMLNAI